MSVYDADVGSIVKINDSKSNFNNKLMYQEGATFDGYCYKDYKTFENSPDDICYIAECEFDNDLFVDYVKDNKAQLIQDGGISTSNSIKEEVKTCLQIEEYSYEYEQDGTIHIIEAKNFDKKLIDEIAEDVFDNVSWEATSTYISQNNWEETIKDYYDNKLKKECDLDL